jgi:hypothetical protein
MNLRIDPTTSQPIAAHGCKSIHPRLLAYDGKSVHPDIGFHGDSRCLIVRNISSGAIAGA